MSATFLGAPASPIEQLAARFAVYGIPLGIPYSEAAFEASVRDAPRAVRERSARFGRMLGHYDFDVGWALDPGSGLALADCGDAPFDRADPRRGAERATSDLRRILARGAMPIVLGGDDSITAISLRAFDGHAPITVLQIDAHLDYRDEVNGIRDGYSSPMRRAAEMPWVARILHCGARGVGSARPQDFRDTLARGNAIFTAREVRSRGADAVLAQVPEGGNVYVAFDCDGLDPAVMPGTSAPLPGGLSFDEAVDLICGCARRGKVVGASFAEHYPSLDTNGITALAIVRLIVNLIGAVQGATS